MAKLSNQSSKDESTARPVNGRGRRRRADVLNALTELLHSQRLADIEVQDIAHQAGISRSNFYFYFPTKGAAVAALIADIQHNLRAVAVDWYGRDDLPDDERIRRGMRATVEYWRAHARLIAAMFEATREDAEVRGIWEETIDGLTAGASERIARDNNTFTGFGPPALATVLVDMTARAMERDVTAIVDSGEPIPETEAALVHVWLSSTARIQPDSTRV
ncbi:TetR/AcrR family transcriptional regulator [Nocardia sp. NPDC052112]|uniref:TetR/AcrR family transcriptional regulator n=1 Tax=Nocardia sp. NPDC052112 TaxID=3155646 RepID=UPI00341CA61F